ncbi:MAG: hypothetical protein DHS20C02_19670 [Micavibrio sp.]|nr:MAG: hypothetical protein DHS20C02_19670 [Micavibrio sp.]
MRLFLTLFAIFMFSTTQSHAGPARWKHEWPRTDFTKSSVDFNDILSGGPPKDGIPAIDDPGFAPASEIKDIGDQEPVITLTYNGIAKAYPLRVLMWHEIANDAIGDMPITVTYCPLCNASIVFDRRLDGKVLDFGVSGKLRYSDMVMYDRQTESWWQQFLGKGIVGEMNGKQLKMVPSRVIPFSKFKATHPDGQVLIPRNTSTRSYGANPYAGYDSLKKPFLYNGNYDGPVPPLAYVVAVGKSAWPLSDIREKGKVENGDLIITWQGGMNSALDKSSIATGRDIGFVSVQKKIQTAL